MNHPEHILVDLDENEGLPSTSFVQQENTKLRLGNEDGEEEEELEFELDPSEDYRRVKPAEKEEDTMKSKGLNAMDAKRLISLGRPELVPISLGILALIVANGSLFAVPLFVGAIINYSTAQPDVNSPGAAESVLLHYVLLLGVIILVSSLASTVRQFFFSIAAERVVARLRRDLFNAIIKQEVAFFDENKTGELANRLASDCTVVQNTVTVNVSQSLRSVITLIGSVGALFFISWKLCIVIILCLPLIILCAVIYGRFIKKLSKAYQDALAKSSDIATEAISLVRTVRSFSNEEFEMSQYGDEVDYSFSLAKKKVYGISAFIGGVGFFGNISICGVLYYGGLLVMRGELTAGSLTSFIIYALTVATSLGSMTSLYGDFMNAVGASERVFELIDRQPKVNWKGGVHPSKLEGIMEMKDVVFTYPSRPDVPVLNGVDLSLTPGKIVALVGPSGGGKSTIAALLEAFYYPTSGTVTMDGVDLCDMDPQVLRRHVGIVSQEPMLFGTTILKNISYGNRDVSFEKVVEAAKMANAHQFISTFPEGYDTIVGERGLRLSGGQKQRVAIARALLTDPKVLLLDEATSALDAESEHLVQQALDTLMSGRTVLVIAHRLSTVKNAHQVCVVHQGKIIERGTHEELLIKPRGMYAKLVKRQLQK